MEMAFKRILGDQTKQTEQIIPGQRYSTAQVG